MRFFVLLWLTMISCAYGQSLPLNNALSFAPPASDVSMMFLNNLFGVVDGVLAGSGSQLFGTMMKVFNSAVLALGSIVSTYVLLLGTMHTAHEGEFLGKKWSSILIPVRTTLGLALLVPKASGYCLIQVFFIWVVVQGIGAADKIWDSALAYLNQGGKIIMEQPSSGNIVGSGNKTQDQTYIAGIKILAAQVCMKGIEQILRNIQIRSRNSPMLQQLGDTPDDKLIKNFLSAAIPDFIGSVNAVNFASQNPNMSPLVLPMPNFSSGTSSGFTVLNGICGSITWNTVRMNFQPGGQGNISGDTNFNLSKSDVQSISQSRAVAVQTLYNFLSNVAVAMINNNPVFGNAPTQNATAAFYANLQYGLPTQNGYASTCKDPDAYKPQSKDTTFCSTWGPAPDGTNISILFTGNEFTNAIKAYYAVMAPVFNLQRAMQNSNQAQQLRGFIRQNHQRGWVFAGAYFFNLIALTGSTKSNSSDLVDPNSGLDATLGPFDPQSKQLTQAIQQNCGTVGNNGSLCWYFSKFKEPISFLKNLSTMIQGGSELVNGCVEVLTINTQSKSVPNTGYIDNPDVLNKMACASTVYGFAGNSYYFNMSIDSAGPDLNTINFNFPRLRVEPFFIPPLRKSCWGWFCVPAILTNWLMNAFIFVANILQIPMSMILEGVLNVILKNPMEQMVWPMIRDGVSIITKNLNNPIVELANMGAYFIQKTIDVYLGLLGVAFIGSFLVALGLAINIIIALVLPFLTAWLAFFTTIGFTTCYYVPMLPYIIFIFGVLSWLFSIIEAVIAAPLVALIVTTPEGEGVIGKGEQGLMILLNIFLRPSLMIIGYVTAIAMTYVSVWILNSSFGISAKFLMSQGNDPTAIQAGLNWVEKKYTWPIVLGNAMFLSLYVSTYLTLVQKVFSLIYNVPDKVLRWIGGHGEGTGQEVNQWVEMTKQKIDDLSTKSQGAIVASVANLQKSTKKSSGKDDKNKNDPKDGSLFS
jgi:defect-in-organelle-trafficking protein DotA